MKKELTNEQKINEAVEAWQKAMLENMKADQALVKIKQDKEKARYNLQQARELVRAMEIECLNN